ncbi:MAG: excinuclease ABC subunit UvrB [Clostridiales bacterium]|nr:excinuclease ABC subunit UvrB [Clostridiales bacterium]
MEQRNFELISKYKPSGDQPQAIQKLVDGLTDGLASQVLLGVTGSGKTFTMANVIAKINKPTLVIAHNKTLAAQLCNELREFFPNNRVEYFVSYYDYYQPEAYIVSSDTYIEKDMAINEEIDKLRSSATTSLLERSDTIVVASVSCIYGLGNPEEYYNLQLYIKQGMEISREEIIKRLVEMQYTRSEIDFKRTTFRAKGDTLDIFPSNQSEFAIRIEFFGDEIDYIYEFNPLSGIKLQSLESIVVFPATHYAVGSQRLINALKQIEYDKDYYVKKFEDEGKLIEAQRLKERVSYDVEMMREIGYCSGIENYSRYFDGREEGQPPYTLMDYFPQGFLTIIDESHMTIPQIRAMYNGDRARKTSLVEYGFRLPAAFDNRPFNFKEFESHLNQTIFVSATPADYEREKSGQIVEQLIRPTGLLDPIVEVVKTDGQIEYLINEINKVIAKNRRVLITTLTKKMAESLTTFLSERGIKVKYLHSEIDTMERIEIINGLRLGDFDVIVGINLLREGLDLPEVELVCILDADKEGFLRSDTALIQTIGRVARNSEGRVIMFADVVTKSMQRAISETARRRQIQDSFNKEHGIVPRTIIKEVKNTLDFSKKEAQISKPDDVYKEIERLKGLMNIASKQLDFETAIELRDRITVLKKQVKTKN